MNEATGPAKKDLFLDAIGKTSSPIRTPISTGEFFFWIKQGVKVNPFDFVVAEQSDGSRTVGVVTEMYTITDAENHLTNYIGNEFGDPQAVPYVERVSSLTARAEVLGNIPETGDKELYTPLPADRRVAFADGTAIAKALGFDQIKGQRIPGGLVRQSNGVAVPVYFDSHYVLGPEGAHVNASGISGLATKTSYLMFLMTAIYQSSKESTAFIIFNVKHSDLLHIDEPATDLSGKDLEMLGQFGLKNEAFGNVTYLLPRGPAGRPQSDTPPPKFQLYAYSLSDVAGRLDLLLSEVPDPQFTLDAMVSYIRRSWDGLKVSFYSEPAKARGISGGPTFDAKTWSDLQTIPDGAYAHTVYNLPFHSTPPRFKREINRLTAAPIFVGRRSANETYLGEKIKDQIKPGAVTVVDIYQVPSQTQAFVVGDVMRSIETLYREGESSKLPNLIIMIDELNTFAPARSESSPITQEIIEIARKGRARRTALFGAQQFKSEVHAQVYGNATVHVVGRTGSAELRASAYSEIGDSARNQVLALRQGELVVLSKTWRTAIRVTFPKPPYRRVSVA